jgi:DNA transformation protein
MKAARAEAALRLEDIPNIGPSIADDLRALDIFEPMQLVGQDPYELYARANAVAGTVQDPCLCDTFIAAVRFMEGGPVRPWWYYTAERKQRLGQEKIGQS